jgi:predicted SnoaL-like aldol condensation-catalyzing enzyme
VPDARSDIVQLVEKGNLVVLHTLVRGRGEYGDVAVEFVNVFRLENGLIQESWSLADSLKLMGELGIKLEATEA